MSLRVRSHPALGFIKPCLPFSAKMPPSGADWIHEIKHDGFRVGMQLQTLVDVWAVMREFMA